MDNALDSFTFLRYYKPSLLKKELPIFLALPPPVNTQKKDTEGGFVRDLGEKNMREKNFEVTFERVENKLLSALKFGAGKLLVNGNEVRGGLAYTQPSLDRQLGLVAYCGEARLATVAKLGVSFGEGLAKNDSEIAQRVRDYKLPEQVETNGLRFEVNEKCSEHHGIRVGNIKGIGFETSCLAGFDEAFNAAVELSEQGASADSLISVLKQVLAADFPVDTPPAPKKQNGPGAISVLNILLSSLARGG